MIWCLAEILTAHHSRPKGFSCCDWSTSSQKHAHRTGAEKHTERSESSNQCNQHLVQAAPLPDFPVNTRPVATQHPPQWCRRCMSEASTFYPKTPRSVATGCSAAGLWWPWYRTPHWVLKTGPAHAATNAVPPPSAWISGRNSSGRCTWWCQLATGLLLKT